mgnify:CR=1 FL=1
MNRFRDWLRKCPPIRWADDFTDTPRGEAVVYGLMVLVVVLWIAYRWKS